jgi:hypothetical protein
MTEKLLHSLVLDQSLSLNALSNKMSEDLAEKKFSLFSLEEHLLHYTLNTGKGLVLLAIPMQRIT